MEIAWLLWICLALSSQVSDNAIVNKVVKAASYDDDPELKEDQDMEHLSVGHKRLKRSTVPTCINGYENVVNSTMCAVDSPNFVPGSEGVSVADRQIILDAHNNYRADVNPTARNMMKVYWDDELAAIAEKWAKQCYVGHDSALKLSRYIPPYGKSPGQNGAFGHSSWALAVAGWYNEVLKFTYGEDPNVYLGLGGWQHIGHYTQVVYDTVVLVGCGYAQCSNGYGKFYFCNYLSGQSDLKRPYDNGTSCADCSNSCSGKLCDCGNKFCFNGGALDINACTCTCQSPWSGTRCLNHPCNGLTCQHGGTLDTSACTCSCIYPYTGTTCETLSCGQTPDPSYCGQWPQNYCTTYSNVPDLCPIKCGVCPVLCNGLACENGGTLNAATCTCSCPSLYTGTTCSQLNCPQQADPDHCGTQWPASYCNIYSNVPPSCPIMCEICPQI